MINRAFGALPPDNMKWMMGKTVAEIEAIREVAEETGEEPSMVAIGNKWQDRVRYDD